jgi:transcriptional regulator with XRE-family HTH domain
MLQIQSNIRLLRSIAGMTQAEFAGRFGISVAMLKSYEGGKAKPDELLIQRLSKYSGVKEDDLLSKKLKEDDVEKVENVERGRSKVQDLETEYGQPIIQVVLNLSYIGKKSADSIDKMADSNLLNAKSIATLVNLLANSDLASQLTSAQNVQHTQEHEDDNLPAEAFLGTAGSDAIKRQTQGGKKKIGHK